MPPWAGAGGPGADVSTIEQSPAEGGAAAGQGPQPREGAHKGQMIEPAGRTTRNGPGGGAGPRAPVGPAVAHKGGARRPRAPLPQRVWAITLAHAGEEWGAERAQRPNGQGARQLPRRTRLPAAADARFRPFGPDGLPAGTYGVERWFVAGGFCDHPTLRLSPGYSGALSRRAVHRMVRRGHARPKPLPPPTPKRRAKAQNRAGPTGLGSPPQRIPAAADAPPPPLLDTRTLFRQAAGLTWEESPVLI